MSWWAEVGDPIDYEDFSTPTEEMAARLRKQRRVLPRDIHILGVGNIGKLVAHALAGAPRPPPITLLLRRQAQVRHWVEQGRAIDLVTHGVSEKRTGFTVESPTQPNLALVTGDIDAEEGPIYHLIVATKAMHTVNAIERIKHRLTPESTILFLQNGMGSVEEVTKQIFPDEETRPNYLIGVTSHGVFTKAAYFSAVHAGFGMISIGTFPRSGVLNPKAGPQPEAPSSRYLLRTITRTAPLAAVGYTSIEILQLQLEKLAVNAVINPLTAIYNCRNGDMLDNFAVTRTMRLLLSEVSLVIRSLPELRGVPNIEERFNPNRLEAIVVGTATKTANNLSSMLQDTQRGHMTEIEYINGYIVRRGERLGLRCVMNYLMVQMVKGRSMMQGKREDHSILSDEDMGQAQYPKP